MSVQFVQSFINKRFLNPRFHCECFVEDGVLHCFTAKVRVIPEQVVTFDLDESVLALLTHARVVSAWVNRACRLAAIMMTSSNGNISALLALCAGNSPVTGEFPSQRPVTRRFDVFFDLRLNKVWVNNGETGNLRRHRAHYDVIVIPKLCENKWQPTT